MASVKLAFILVLFGVVDTILCEVQTIEDGFETDVRDACTREFHVTTIEWDKKAEDQPHNTQCYLKCLVVKTASKMESNPDFAATISAVKVPEETQQQLEKCAAEAKDDSCLAYTTFLLCLTEYKA